MDKTINVIRLLLTGGSSAHKQTPSMTGVSAALSGDNGQEKWLKGGKTAYLSAQPPTAGSISFTESISLDLMLPWRTSSLSMPPAREVSYAELRR